MEKSLNIVPLCGITQLFWVINYKMISFFLPPFIASTWQHNIAIISRNYGWCWCWLFRHLLTLMLVVGSLICCCICTGKYYIKLGQWNSIKFSYADEFLIKLSTRCTTKLWSYINIFYSQTTTIFQLIKFNRNHAMPHIITMDVKMVPANNSQ